MDPSSLYLAALSLVAAIINGAIGYGFSSIITPVAVLFISNKVLNPALVLCELGVNLTLLWVERGLIRRTWRRAVPFICGVLPGVILGSLALAIIAATTVKIILYVVLLPLILIQLTGVQWPIKKERLAGSMFGGVIGFMYSLTTVSGPPLALFWRNQGLAKDEFRCVVSQVRVAEASFTVISYWLLGLFNSSSMAIVPPIILPVLVGIPVGVFLLRNVSHEFFKRFVMAVDGALVSFGLGSVLGTAGYVTVTEGYELFILGVVVVVVLAAKSLRNLPQAAGEDSQSLYEPKKRRRGRGRAGQNS